MAKHDTDEKFNAAVGGCAVAIFNTVASYSMGIYTAFVVQMLWGWFLTPVVGASAPSIPLIYGLLLIVSLTTHQITKFKTKEEHSTGVVLAARAAWNSTTLGCGYIAHLLA